MIWNEPERLRRAMHPQCMQAGHYQGAFELFDREAFIEAMASGPSEPPGTPYTAGSSRSTGPGTWPS